MNHRAQRKTVKNFKKTTIPQLKNRFQEDENSIQLGTRAFWDIPAGPVVKTPYTNAGAVGWIPG